MKTPSDKVSEALLTMILGHDMSLNKGGNVRTGPGQKTWHTHHKTISRPEHSYRDNPKASRYHGEALRRLRAQRGVGPVRRVDPKVRASWTRPFKRVA